MGNKVNEDLISTVRSFVGSEFTDMDIIRALHLAKNDATAAINIIFDTPNFNTRPRFHSDSSLPKPKPKSEVKTRGTVNDNNENTSLLPGVEEAAASWWYACSADVAGLSTSKGRRVKAGDQVLFTFPSAKSSSFSPHSSKGFGKGRLLGASCSEIVRFSTKDSGEIGRIPNEWARCLVPLVRDKKVMIEGFCKSAPDVLSITDTVLLTISVYINNCMFKKKKQTSLKVSVSSMEETVVHPLPNLLRLLGMQPFKKAVFTPADFYPRKRPFHSEEAIGVHTPLIHLKTSKNQPKDGGDDRESEASISDVDLDNIVGVGDSSDLEEMEPPSTLLCELRPYQKQALHWMLQLEKGKSMNEADTTLHPCWEAYRLEDKRGFVIYLNAFSGDATTEFPSTLQMARGGILADAMGLGKTIMAISLLVASSIRSSSSSNPLVAESSSGDDEVGGLDQLVGLPNKRNEVPRFNQFNNQRKKLLNGGNLIVCPVTLLGQWKTEIETHTRPGTLSLCIHYGQSRAKDAKLLAQYDVVITSYGVLASEFSTENSEDNGGLYSLCWFRVILDEAHIIKSSKSQVSMAAAALDADCRWCLTGTPIQNDLEDLYSLIRFLKVEPWESWAWWNKLVQKPFEEGDDRGLKLVQSILKPIMLRRTKSSTDREGRPILVLPPVDIKVIYCELTETEQDFYGALYKRSKVKFDQFVEQGRILHNYASILELLLRLRQCCDHPFLVMSRGDTQEYADLNKLAKRFLKRNEIVAEEEAQDVPSLAYVKEVMDELRKGDHAECPICLEAFEDAVLTPCAHRLCRECLLASWKNHASGLCPVCRKAVNRKELITAPTENRFQVDVEKDWVESSKIVALVKELEILRSSGSKSIIFSQWTSFLDLLQIPLPRNSFHFVRLDGTLNQQQRERVIKQFSEDEGIMVLLMSLKAGGVGINLTAATNAFVMDPWWNPAVEEQAVMRIHRIGQTKPVMIRRFIVKGTVEERMEAVQARKQKLISGALTDEEVRRARIDELKLLFA